MKKNLLWMLLLLPAIAGAQIVNIPDADFKEILTDINTNDFADTALDSEGNEIAVDANNDGEIDSEEALAVWQLWIQGNPEVQQISSLEGIESFTNLRVFIFHSFEITSFDATALVNLEQLDFSFNQFLTDVDCSGLPNLKVLVCGYTPITGLNLEGLVSLERIDSNHALSLESLDFADCLALERINCLDCDSLSSLNVDGLPNLNWIGCECDSLDEVILNLPSLAYLWFSSSSSPVDIIDLSGCPAIEQLNIQLSPDGGLNYLNLKNGDTEYMNFIIDTNISYVCIDEGEEMHLAAAIEDGALVNAYCSDTPGGSYNTIAGTLTFDADSNGCEGDGSINSFVKVIISDGTNSGTTYSDLSGGYEFYTPAGTYTVTPEFENNWFVASPASATVALDTVDNTITTENFCIAANGVHPDVEVLIVPLVQAQPGFDAEYKIVYRNNGNQVLSGDVHFSFDDSVLDYVSALPVEDNISGDTAGWSYTGLMPFESRSAIVTLNVNGPMESPAVNIDDVLAFSASATPTAGDETPGNNSVVYEETVVGSYDPNDKICLEGPTPTPDMIGEYLHYNINFENTGTAPATFIVVKDVIDPEQFDISSLQVIDASHGMVAKVTGDTVEFRFDEINLGPLEKGNVLFKVKTLSTLQVGDEVSNYADIFFDYNWPIVTNEAVTEFITEEIIVIPDTNFKQLLLSAGNASYPEMAKDSEGAFMVIDANADGEVQVSEAEAVWEIYIDYSATGLIVTSMEGIQHFTNLRKLATYNGDVLVLPLEGLTSMEELIVGGNSISALDTSGMPNLVKAVCNSNALLTLDFTNNTELTEIACDMNQLTSLEVAGLSNLQHLHCTNNELTTLDLTGLTALKTFVLEINNITALDFSETPALEYVWCNKNDLTALDFSGLTNLWHITCYDNTGLESLQLSGCTALEELLCHNTALTTIDFTGLESLTNVAVYDAAITSVTVTDSPALTHLWLQENALTEITLENLPLLMGLELRNNLLTSVDVSACSQLYGFSIKDNPITSLNLANGEGSAFNVVHTFAEGQVVDVCVDGPELDYYEGIFTSYQNVTVHDCTMGTNTPGFAAASVYPNPSDGLITVAGGETISEIILLDVHGRVLTTLPVNDTTVVLDMMAQAAGIYFLKISFGNSSIVKKIIKE